MTLQRYKNFTEWQSNKGVKRYDNFIEGIMIFYLRVIHDVIRT
jgi:hypothetical protein